MPSTPITAIARVLSGFINLPLGDAPAIVAMNAFYLRVLTGLIADRRELILHEI
jgi:hypothetical protein